MLRNATHDQQLRGEASADGSDGEAQALTEQFRKVRRRMKGMPDKAAMTEDERKAYKALKKRAAELQKVIESRRGKEGAE